MLPDVQQITMAGTATVEIANAQRNHLFARKKTMLLPKRNAFFGDNKFVLGAYI